MHSIQKEWRQGSVVGQRKTSRQIGQSTLERSSSTLARSCSAGAKYGIDVSMAAFSPFAVGSVELAAQQDGEGCGPWSVEIVRSSSLPENLN